MANTSSHFANVDITRRILEATCWLVALANSVAILVFLKPNLVDFASVWFIFFDLVYSLFFYFLVCS